MTDHLTRWIGRKETVTEVLSSSHGARIAATLDEPTTPADDGTPLPLPWHWCFFLPRTPAADLDTDGHPKRGGFMPPVPLPRRMFAGSEMTLTKPLRLGLATTRHGEILNVEQKTGKSGALAFVTVRYRFEQGGKLCLEEQQTIVYREAGAPIALPAPATLPAPPAGAWWRDIAPDSRLLFRFSALTFNAHRIHYDRDYARDVEGYPGLVVHGPLTAMLLSQLVRHHEARPITRFSFRALAPLFDTAPFRLLGIPSPSGVTLSALAPDGSAAVTAEAGFA